MEEWEGGGGNGREGRENEGKGRVGRGEGEWEWEGWDEGVPSDLLRAPLPKFPGDAPVEERF